MSNPSQLNEDVISESAVDTEEWNELVTSRYFHKLISFISNKVTRFTKETDKLASQPSLDTSFKVAALAAKKEELSSLLRKFDFFKEQHRLYLIDKQKRGN